MLNKIKLVLCGLVLMTSSAFASNNTGTFFGSVYMDTYEWSGVKGDNVVKAGGTDVSYGAGVDGGYFNDDVSIYGFHEVYTTDDHFSKLTSHINLGDLPITAYVQGSYYDSAFGSETRGLVGVGYPMTFGSDIKINFTPFVGYALSTSDFGVEDSAMVGWTVNMKVFGTTITSWHETDYQNDSPTANGAVGAFWDLNESWFVGTQYRYWYNSGGNEGYADALIARVGMRF